MVSKLSSHRFPHDLMESYQIVLIRLDQVTLVIMRVKLYYIASLYKVTGTRDFSLISATSADCLPPPYLEHRKREIEKRSRQKEETALRRKC